MMRLIDIIKNLYRKSDIPVLNCALIKVEGGNITMSFTDLCVAVSVNIGSTDKKYDPALVLVKDVLEQCRTQGADAAFTIYEGNLTCTGKNGRKTLRVAAIEPDEFPILPRVGGIKTYPVKDTGVFWDAGMKASASICKSEKKCRNTAMTGLYMEPAGEGFSAITGTDAVSLTRIETKAFKADKPTIVSASEFKRVAKALGKEPVRMGSNDDFIVFKAADGHIALLNLLHRGYGFPDCSGVLRKYCDWESGIKLDTGDLKIKLKGIIEQADSGLPRTGVTLRDDKKRGLSVSYRRKGAGKDKVMYIETLGRKGDRNDRPQDVDVQYLYTMVKTFPDGLLKWWPGKQGIVGLRRVTGEYKAMHIIMSMTRVTGV